MLCAQRSQLLQAVAAAAWVMRRSQTTLLQAGVCSCKFSTDGSRSSSPERDTMAEFQQKVAALQSGQALPNLQMFVNAASEGASTSGRSNVRTWEYNSNVTGDSNRLGSMTSGSSSSNDGRSPQLVSPQYGYAVLGGIDPEAPQQPGDQQPRLHPSRMFSHGDVYAPTDLSPLSKEEQEAWLPKPRRTGKREQRISVADVEQQLDYKNTDFLLNFVSASGRIKPRRLTGLKPVLQAKVARTVKLARQMALLPYDMRVGDSGEGDRWRRMRQFKAAQIDADK